MPSLEQVDAALAVARLVVLANPHNPTGVQLERDGLIAVAAAHIIREALRLEMPFMLI